MFKNHIIYKNRLKAVFSMFQKNPFENIFIKTNAMWVFVYITN